MGRLKVEHAQLDTEAPIPVRIHRACILEELADDDDAEVKEEL
jgi:sRNA-binding carbon storage regulator CsrA